MTTSSTTRPPVQPVRAAGPAPAASGPQGMAPVDPIKLLKQHAALLIICFMVGSALGLGAHLVLLRLWPVFKAHVVYECTPPLTDLTKDQNNQLYNQDEFDRYMGTQAALMMSEPVLQATAKDPEVQRTSWARQYVNSRGEYQPSTAAIKLEDRLTARVQPMTNLIRFTCTWKDATDVATIVNAANRAYLEDMKTYGRRMDKDRREVLDKRLRDLRDQMDSLVSKRERLIAENNMTGDSTQSTHLLLEIQSLLNERSTIAGRVAQLKSVTENYKNQISKSGKVDYPERIREAALNDPTVREMDREIADIKSREQAMLIQGIRENHPDMVAVKSLIESKKSTREAMYEDTMRKLFEGDLDSSKNNLSAYEATLVDLDTRIRELQEKLKTFLGARLQIDQLRDQLERMQTDMNDTDNAIRQLDSIGSLKESSRIRVIRQGQTPTDVNFPKIYILIPAGAVLLPMLVAGLLFLREVFDQRVRGPADLALIPRLRVLGVIPDASEDPARPANVATAFRDSPQSAITESFRQLRAPLIKRMEQAGHKSLLVIPGMPGSGGTSVVANIALGSAASDLRVLIIDANFRRPGVHKVFGLSDGPGLGDVLAGASDLSSAIQPTSITNLSVLTAGTTGNRALPERLATDSMAKLVRECGDRFDLVLVDAPPAIVSGDGLALANRCDAVALVARALHEKRGLVARLQNQLSDSRAEFLGVVLNAARASAGGYFKRNIKATHEYQNSKAA